MVATPRWPCWGGGSPPDDFLWTFLEKQLDSFTFYLFIKERVHFYPNLGSSIFLAASFQEHPGTGGMWTLSLLLFLPRTWGCSQLT